MTRRKAGPSVRFTSEARGEAQRAARSYEFHQPGLGQRFRERLDDALTQITDHPEGYEKVTDRYRRAFLHPFPFVIVYRLATGSVEIIGVLPTRSDPAGLHARTGARRT